MGAASYIGRVGGLAVALGVGTAIATGHGIAAADATDPDSANSAPSEQSTGTSSATADNTTTTTSTDSTASKQTEISTDTESGGSDDTSRTTSIVTNGATVSAQTNTGTSAGTATTDAPEESGEGTVPAEDAELPGEPTSTETVDPEPSVTETVAPESTPTETADPDPTPGSELPHESTQPTGGGVVSSTVVTPDSHLRTGNTALSAAQPSTTFSARTVESLADPAATVQEPAKVAVFADARALASVTPQPFSPLTAVDPTSTPVPTAAPANLLTAVANVVSSAINWIMNPLAGTAPTTPLQPPLIWGLLAFARREFENFFSALAGQSATPATNYAAEANNTFALAAATVENPLYNPFPSHPDGQLSPSTKFVGWVTGPNVYPTDPLLANTLSRYSVYGTDVGTMWDNGIPDNPNTTINEHQVLIAVGDTYGGPNMQTDWRSNTIFRSSDTVLADGMQIPDGQWKTGNWFGGAPLGPDGNPTRARQVVFPEGLPAGVTLIPTAGISVPTPGSPYGAIQYVSFMSVSQWGSPGTWTTNYSAIAWSDDNGEIFHVAPQTVRYNQQWSGNQNFQQSAFVRPGDGYVYMYGTPNGRQGAAYVSRVPEKDILNLSQYEYWNKGSAGGWFGWGATTAGWYKNSPTSASDIFGVDQGACGVANPGNQVSEMSVQYNKTLKKFVVLYGDQSNNIVMRTSDTPQGSWSSAKVLMPQQTGGIYAPMMHPWSPSTLGTGNDLYWNLSLFSDYNVMLMRTDLTKV
jgi:Domain of unknown function (DUF4185)